MVLRVPHDKTTQDWPDAAAAAVVAAREMSRRRNCHVRLEFIEKRDAEEN